MKVVFAGNLHAAAIAIASDIETRRTVLIVDATPREEPPPFTDVLTELRALADCTLPIKKLYKSEPVQPLTEWTHSYPPPKHRDRHHLAGTRSRKF